MCHGACFCPKPATAFLLYRRLSWSFSQS
jgi:hypothetical protein